MINHVWTVLCSSAVVDQFSNLVSLFNILEEIMVKDDPKPDGVLPIECYLVSFWTRTNPNEPCRGISRITLLNPNGEAIKQIKSEIDLTNYERLRARGQFKGIPAKESGIYVFQIELLDEGKDEWEVVAKLPLKINFTKVEKDNDSISL